MDDMDELDLPLGAGLHRQASVGFSDDRTPVKHRLLFNLAGMIIGSAPYVATQWALHHPPCCCSGHLIVDLTAGDGVGDGINTWWRGSSPAIFAKLASQNKRVRVHLYEKDKAAFQALFTNLVAMLPIIGFVQVSETSWINPVMESHIDATFGDARELENFEMRPYEFLFINDDPNNMHGLVLDLERLQEVIAIPQGGGPRFVTFMTTMGCNAGGLKMLLPKHRQWWFTHIEQAIAIVRRHSRLDLWLFEIVGDSAQWAYLMLAPKKWSGDKIKRYCSEFTKQELQVAAHSWHYSQVGFVEAINRLFYSKQERADGAVWKI